MKAEPTAGEWKVEASLKHNELWIQTDKVHIADVAGIDEESEANARIMAASKELLEALKMCQSQLLKHVDFDAWDDEDREACEAAKEAVLKATKG